MNISKLIYIATLLPLITRGLLIVRFRLQMKEILSEEEQDREAHRSLILAFAGFSFTGVFALVVLEPAIRSSVQGAVFFLLVSFLAYLWALNLQGYKALRWQDQAATALVDTGSLCLVLALVALFLSSQFSQLFIISASGLALVVWLADYIIRMCIDFQYLKACENKKKINRRL